MSDMNGYIRRRGRQQKPQEDTDKPTIPAGHAGAGALGPGPRPGAQVRVDSRLAAEAAKRIFAKGGQ